METLVHIKLPNLVLEGMLQTSSAAKGIVLFAHGSGSSRHSPRNNFVAKILAKAGLATLLIDLLSTQEDTIYKTRFDIELLAERLSHVAAWLKINPETKNLPLGLFGASTGAAAALALAENLSFKVRAVVSRGGRPDLAMAHLPHVKAPTLFIVGGNDLEVIKLNQAAFEELQCIKQFQIIPGATHLFEETGCLEMVATMAKEWFLIHLANQPALAKSIRI